MSRTITVAGPSYRRYDLLGQMIASAEQGTLVPDQYLIVDNGGSLVPAAHGIPTAKTTIENPGRNLGVAATWNVVMSRNDDIIIMACDDVRFGARTIEALVKESEEHPEVGFFFPESASMFTVFLLRKSLYDRIGAFDEGFWPAYFEDNDYFRRLCLAGEQRFPVVGVDVGYYHHISATLRTYNTDEMNTHHGRFKANQDYYYRKWGGLPHHETYATPFNGKKP